MKTIFVGIDLAIAKNKSLPVCFCSWQGKRLVPFPVRRLPHKPPRGRGNLAVLNGDLVNQYVEEAAVYIRTVAFELSAKIERIGIDAPRMPRTDQSPRRQSEKAMDRAGISCFATPSERDFERIFDKV